MLLPAIEGEPFAELGQGLRYPQRHGLLQGLLVGLLAESAEVEHERVLGHQPGKVGVACW